MGTRANNDQLVASDLWPDKRRLGLDEEALFISHSRFGQQRLVAVSHSSFVEIKVLAGAEIML